MLGNSYQWQISNCVAKIVQCTPKKVESFIGKVTLPGITPLQLPFALASGVIFSRSVCGQCLISYETTSCVPSKHQNSTFNFQEFQFFAPKSLGFIKFSRKKKTVSTPLKHLQAPPSRAADPNLRSPGWAPPSRPCRRAPPHSAAPPGAEAS